MSSDDEVYYDDSEEYGDAEDEEEDSEDEGDFGFDCSAVYDEELTLRPRKARFTVLSEADIVGRQTEAIQDVATVLSVDPSQAAALLRHFKWSVSQVNDEWFQDEDKVRRSVGLLSLSTEPAATKPPSKTHLESELTCGICFEVFPRAAMAPALCNQHYFCATCWTGYVRNAISEGPGCVNLRCPDPACAAAVPDTTLLKMAPESLRPKFMHYLLRSYVDDNRNAKWCPAPGCEFALEFFPDSSNYDVVCKCEHKFCWNCLEEAHRPVDCETVAKWILKNSAESENMNWILAHSKACPKCKRPIEKNQGCMHMTCTPPCKYEFCWLCLGAWSEHGEKTGGFYACNRYEVARSEGQYDEAERRKEMAQNSLEKYTHYYERWAANEQARVKANESLKEMQATKIEILSERQNQPVSQLKFVTDAWLQVVECRRVLKWTYAYGYYLPAEESAKRQFFEYIQGEADSALENLHRLAEKELLVYVDADAAAAAAMAEQPVLPFAEFRSRLAGLTSVTHTYFENLVRALENGLADVEAQQQQQGHRGGKQGPGTKADKKGSAAEGTSSSGSGKASAIARLARVGARSRSSAPVASASQQGIPGPAGAGSAARGTPGGSSGAGQGGNPAAGQGRAAEEPRHWSCEHCTFANRPSSQVCEMCNLPRTNRARR